MRLNILLALLILLGFGLSMPQSFSQDRPPTQASFEQTTEQAAWMLSRDPALVQALGVLQQVFPQTLQNLSQGHVRILFKDMRTLNKNFRDFDALSWITTDGQRLIYMNQKHATAPPEALAALLAHESLHHDAENSIQEEIVGWQTEARAWHKLKALNPSLNTVQGKQNALINRLNTLEAEDQAGTLPETVRHNRGYAGLAETSPGFEGGRKQTALLKGFAN